MRRDSLWVYLNPALQSKTAERAGAAASSLFKCVRKQTRHNTRCQDVRSPCALSNFCKCDGCTSRPVSPSRARQRSGTTGRGAPSQRCDAELRQRRLHLQALGAQEVCQGPHERQGVQAALRLGGRRAEIPQTARDRRPGVRKTKRPRGCASGRPGGSHDRQRKRASRGRAARGRGRRQADGQPARALR